MRFTGDPNYDAFNWYKEHQKSRSGPARVVQYQNNGGFSVVTGSGNELCSFRDIRGGGGQFSCVLRINPKYSRYTVQITRVLDTEGFDWRKAQFGYYVENLDAMDLAMFSNTLFRIAKKIKDIIRFND